MVLCALVVCLNSRCLGDRRRNCLRGHWRSQFDQLPQVLYCGEEHELLSSTSEASKSEPVEAKVLFHVSEQHLHFSPQSTRMAEGFSILKSYRLLSCTLIKGHRQGTLRTSRALGANWTFLAIARCGAIDVNAVFLAGGAMFQNFALWTNVMIFRGIKGESFPGQQAVG